jgi:hypothetical protein
VRFTRLGVPEESTRVTIFLFEYPTACIGVLRRRLTHFYYIWGAEGNEHTDPYGGAAARSLIYIKVLKMKLVYLIIYNIDIASDMISILLARISKGWDAFFRMEYCLSRSSKFD